MERPIILKAHEVRGIIDGRQTQLRRIIKPTVIAKHEKPCPADYPHKLCNHTWPGKRVGMFCPDCYQSLVGECPFGQVGDRLWGRETYALDAYLNRVTFKDIETHPRLMKWRSPAIMPRWASRILLEIVSVRVERLQDISEEDAADNYPEAVEDENGNTGDYRYSMFCLWDKMYGKKSTDANPWVWVLTFKRVEA